MKKNTKNAGYKIAIIGWGSLLFPQNKKKLSIVGNKFNENGPQVPLELTRISSDGRLTLVIDEDAGVENNALYAISKHKTINKAFDELVKTEKVNPKLIGVVDIRNKQTSESATKHSNTTMSIANWARKNKFDAVLWCALGRKFKDKINVKFSPENAVSYLSKLPVQERNNSIKYIKSLPKTIKTPVTQLVAKEF